MRPMRYVEWLPACAKGKINFHYGPEMQPMKQLRYFTLHDDQKSYSFSVLFYES